ncbi:hypothetical protein LDENG_00059840 [Lucifuga dentata]|nr:hypothetical protein LDENG_00059840 [Lucifuga dentata]
MASAFYTEDLTCCVCQNIFTDPVTLLCGHSFCRECIRHYLSTRLQCPQCQTAVSTEHKCLPTSLILQNLAEKAKEAQRMSKGDEKEKTEVSEWFCPEHEEKLKLFCVTDQQLACIICRDGEKHNGHKFKPIKEAAASLRQELKQFMPNLSGDIHVMESLANTQREELTKTKETSRQLMSQISNQFGEMHRFLRKREVEIKNELKEKETDAIEKMHERLKAIETALSESRELEVKVTSVLDITDSEGFLKTWTQGNSKTTPEQLFGTRSNDLQVVNSSLCLGPYESHLQFFMWKEMLQVIQPRAEQLSVWSNNTNKSVSDDGRCVFCVPTSRRPNSGFSFPSSIHSSSGYSQPTNLFGQAAAFGFGSTTQHKQYNDTSIIFSGTTTNHAFSSNKFSSGQHYWETEVGKRGYWELGVTGIFLKYDNQKYAISNGAAIRELTFAGRPRKIGVYLNCNSKELSFYDADNMKLIHTKSSCKIPVQAYFNTGYGTNISTVTLGDLNPLTVCWY